MGIQTRSKINQLHHILPEGLLVDSAWLQEHGYSRPLIAKYVHSGWLETPVYRIYKRPKAGDNDAINWEEVVASLQTLLDLPVIVGGRTALELQGYAHYLAPAGPAKIHLYADEKLPRWLILLPLKQKLVFHKANLFQAEKKSVDDSSTRSWETRYGTLFISTPERAILEVLDEMPQHETFHQADMLMQGLTTLSPRRLNKLLANCRSIKTKRLFLWFAERYNHQWFAGLNQKKIDLGSGKRVLSPGGQLNQKYKITVPKDLDSNG